MIEELIETYRTTIVQWPMALSENECAPQIQILLPSYVRIFPK